MLRRSLALVVGLTVLVPGCEGGDTRIETSRPNDRGETLYETTTVVLERPDHPAMLCLGTILESLPPQCGTVEVTNWDWDKVDGEESRAGTKWGGPYHLVGTFNGTSFTVTDISGPAEDPPPETSDETHTPCPEPNGGWSSPEPSRTGEDSLDAAIITARSKQDFAGAWISQLTPLSEEQTLELDARGLGPVEIRVVLNLAFTSDLERHEPEARRQWGGPLCLVRHDHAYRELEQINTGLFGETSKELGLQVLSSGVHEPTNVVHLRVVVIHEDTLQMLESHYGEGAVIVTAALTPMR